ncbi:hypothetical protein Tco_0670981 [Tanacetum coccineum]
MENEEDPVSKQQISDAQAFGWRTLSGKRPKVAHNVFSWKMKMETGSAECKVCKGTCNESSYAIIGLLSVSVTFKETTWEDVRRAEQRRITCLTMVHISWTEQSSVVTDGLIHSAGSPAANHQRFFATRIRVALTSGSTQEPEKSQHVVPQVVAVETLMQQIS